MNRRSFLQSASQLIIGSTFSPILSNSTWHDITATLPVIIDADTANEVDDLYAIVRALLEPRLNILGITAAQYHTSPQTPNDSVGESQRINEEILQLMNRTEVPAIAGSNFPMVNEQRAQPSKAAEFIIEQALAIPESEKLSVVILGPATNIASAILINPNIIPKLSINYLGFWYNVADNTWSKREFNTNNDPNAVNALLNTAGLEFRVMTATTSQHLVFEKAVMDQLLKGKGSIGDYLINRWENFDRWWQKDDQEKTKWIMWDVAIIEALAYPELCEEKIVTTPHDNLMRPIKVYTNIEVEAMKENFAKALSTHLGRIKK